MDPCKHIWLVIVMLLILVSQVTAAALMPYQMSQTTAIVPPSATSHKMANMAHCSHNVSSEPLNTSPVLHPTSQQSCCDHHCLCLVGSCATALMISRYDQWFHTNLNDTKIAALTADLTPIITTILYRPPIFG